MLTDTLNKCIMDMKAVQEMENVSSDTKKQAAADFNFQKLVASLKQTVIEVELAVDNSDFKPSSSIVSSLKNFISLCDRIVQVGAANTSTTQFISNESKKLNTALGQEWYIFYSNLTSNMLNLLGIIKNILQDDKKVIYAANKIKKAANWNSTVDNYNYLKQGMDEANLILKDLDLEENSEILTFLKLVSEGNATILNLTDDVLAWVKKENLADKLFINSRKRADTDG